MWRIHGTSFWVCLLALASLRAIGCQRPWLPPARPSVIPRSMRFIYPTALLLGLLLGACGGSYVDRDAETDGTGGSAPSGIVLTDFTLVDINPASPTFQQSRSLSEAEGKVLLLYMVQFT